jgi:hypothetical protein
MSHASKNVERKVIKDNLLTLLLLGYTWRFYCLEEVYTGCFGWRVGIVVGERVGKGGKTSLHVGTLDILRRMCVSFLEKERAGTILLSATVLTLRVRRENTYTKKPRAAPLFITVAISKAKQQHQYSNTEPLGDTKNTKC